MDGALPSDLASEPLDHVRHLAQPRLRAVQVLNRSLKVLGGISPFSGQRQTEDTLRLEATGAGCAPS